MLAVDLRFPNPKLFRREFIELIWKEEKVGGEERIQAARGGWEDKEGGLGLRSRISFNPAWAGGETTGYLFW